MAPNSEESFLGRIYLKILILGAIAAACSTAVGAYYTLKADAVARTQAIADRVTTVETNVSKMYVDKPTFDTLVQEVHNTHDDVITIKTLLQARHGKGQ